MTDEDGIDDKPAVNADGHKAKQARTIEDEKTEEARVLIARNKANMGPKTETQRVRVRINAKDLNSETTKRRGGIMKGSKLNLKDNMIRPGFSIGGKTSTSGILRYIPQSDVNYDVYPSPQINSFVSHSRSYMDFKEQAEQMKKHSSLHRNYQKQVKLKDRMDEEKLISEYDMQEKKEKQDLKLQTME